MAGRDITEGRATRSIAVDLGVGTGTLWQNTGDSYDVAIGGIPFLLAVDDQHPYERATAQFRKQQFDSQRDPGEQSLTGWWLRSQSSFHAGEGVEFYDPLANPYSTTLASNSYRIKESYGVDIWTPGQVTLLRDVLKGHNTTGLRKSNGRSNQYARSIQYNGTDSVLLLDEYDIDKVLGDGTVVHFINSINGGSEPIYAICDDGTYAYFISNVLIGGNMRLHMYKKPLTGDNSTGTATTATSGDCTLMFTDTGTTVTNAVMNYVKQRIVLCVNNKIYELTPNSGSIGTPVYTHPNTSYVFTSVSESGSAIYVSGYNGIRSSIFKFNLDTTTGAMPTLTSAITAAEMPAGEIVHKIFYYLGYMCIGTSKGVRIASVSPSDGALTYGPLIVETHEPVYDFAARETYIWATAGVGSTLAINSSPGVIRIDLSNEIDNLRFAYANDIHYDSIVDNITTACAFLGNSDRLTFTTTATSSGVGYVYVEEATKLRTSGYLQTGYIRYNTLEQKNFKRIVGHGDFQYGSMSLQSVSLDGNIYDINSYDSAIGAPESTITQPAGAQDAIGLRFVLYRDATDNTVGSIFKGYQLKAVPASPRQRIIKIPMLCFDTETDKYNSTLGYEGRGYARLAALEDIEAAGDVVSYQDFRTGEIFQCLIEEVAFANVTPPDKKLTNFGGIVTITIRTV